MKTPALDIAYKLSCLYSKWTREREELDAARSTLHPADRDSVREMRENDRIIERNEDTAHKLLCDEFLIPCPELKGTVPVVLYFANDAERNEFIAAVQEANPNLQTRKW